MSPLPPADRGPRAELVLLIGALSAFAPLSIDMYLPGLPAIAKDLGASPAEAQLTLTACLIGLALGQLVAGPLSDTYGRRRPLLAGLALYTLASLLCALAPSIWLFVVLRVLQGLGGAAGIVIARAVVRDHYAGSAAARFFALTMLVNGLAPILAPVIGGQLLLVTTWQGIFVVLGVIGAALFLFAALRLAESLPPERRRSGRLADVARSYRGLLLDRGFMSYVLAAALAFAAMFAYISASPFVLEDLFGQSPQAFSLFFALNALGIVVASQVSGYLVGRIAPVRIMTGGLLMAAFGGVVLVAAAAADLGLVAILLGFFLVVASYGFVAPNATALALADQPHQAGSASALLGACQFLVGAIAAPLVSIGGVGSAVPMAVVIAGFAWLALGTFLTLHRPARRAPATG
jgi:MFS transporter, DHA1 family, multidrug resistance protein